MILTGNNKLVLTQQAMAHALEDAINSAMKSGKDYIRVTEVQQKYTWGDFEVTITTDSEAKNEESDNSTDAS